ncbi:hypothetical protein Tco_1460102 [Tanacetum coccineum]
MLSLRLQMFQLCTYNSFGRQSARSLDIKDFFDKDFLNCALQKKDVIQYPCFTKLIIVDLMKNFDSIPPRLEEDYHSIKDDILLVSVYTIGNVTVRGMLIPDEFITDDIYACNTPIFTYSSGS